MKTWQDLKSSLSVSLTSVYPEGEINTFFKILAEHFLGTYSLSPDQLSQNIPPDAIVQVPSVLERLAKQEPIQYVLGYTWFYNLRISVTPEVLIPRQETEELVHWVLQDQQFKMGPKVLDIGTGSGCIALALAAYLRSATVWGTDISSAALEVATANALRNEIQVVQFFQHDILTEPLPIEEQFHAIVSNPPYIRPSEKKVMTENVLQYEPHLALFAEEEDPLVFYRKIGEMAQKALLPGGTLYFEMNEFLKDELESLLNQQGYNFIQSQKDLNGNWRMLKCKL